MIINKTPLRLSLSGGGSDLPIYFNSIKSNVLNFAINLYITTIIKKNKKKGVIFNSLDLKKKENYLISNPKKTITIWQLKFIILFAINIIKN